MSSSEPENKESSYKITIGRHVNENFSVRKKFVVVVDAKSFSVISNDIQSRVGTSSVRVPFRRGPIQFLFFLNSRGVLPPPLAPSIRYSDLPCE